MEAPPSPASSSDPGPDPGHDAHRARRRLITLAAAGLLLLVAAAAWIVLTRPAAGPKTASLPSPTRTPESVQISAGKVPAITFNLSGGYVAHVFAEGMDHARDLVFSPGGTLLVSSPASNTVTALPDADHNGVADSSKVVANGSAQTHGLAFHGNKLFMAELGRVNRYTWDEANLTATLEKTLFELPTAAGHTSRTLSIAPDGKLYLTVGSTCNVCREPNAQHATILVSDVNGAAPRVFASGLRNAAFSAINPATGELWATEMGRDNLGDNIPPDEINIVREGKNYGWPLCYGNRVHDTQFDGATKYIADPCASTIAPTFQVPAHNAPLGLAFIKSAQFPADQQGDLVVAYHGSWNRSVPDGYKIVRLGVAGNAITASEDFMTGFISGRTVAGRPVDVIFDTRGNLFVSDDYAGAIYIIQKQS
jgi:glucose/arabinose dehydrogenase